MESSLIPASERFERWRDGLAGTFDVFVPEGERAEDVRYDTSIWQLGTVMLSDNTFGPRLQARTARHVRADHVDHYRVILQTAGLLRLDADGRRHAVNANQLVISDMSRPEGYETTSGGNIVLFVPREMLDGELPRAFDLHGVMPVGSAAGMLAEHLRALARMAPELRLSEAAALTRATVHLLAASLFSSAQTLAHARATMENTLLRQICRFIDLHLSDSELSVETLSSFFKVSRSTLYRLFEPLGGIASYVRERRLARIHEILSDAGKRRQYLQRLAEDHGFKSATHFSRAFREHYGYSPSDVRHLGASAALSIPAANNASNGRADFDRWLRSLRE
ncbi:helix-turn-helix domain-containing protein [Variovorax sp.]|uniref:AraC-like ligand-binding domain-containing protein n=1 Tax=Variovorax sp. TaxID=1871043 RepID=UPI002D5CD800|nr:helix-turn-helix domain-containing protein [Variovorax sp.]HYP84486.1 helix-turn-helix domain-containing protein [Variovorax sp.]